MSALANLIVDEIGAAFYALRISTGDQNKEKVQLYADQIKHKLDELLTVL